MDYKAQIDTIKMVTNQIVPNKVTILTGKNGSGKSLIRKLVGFYLTEKIGVDKKVHITASTSLQQRTESQAAWGAFSSCMHDDPTNPTSLETFTKIQSLINICKPDNKRFIIIDEPEIGMGEEMVAALTEFLNVSFNLLPENCLGVLIITHNRYIVENVKSEFLNIDGMSKVEWLNRKIVPTNLEQFKIESFELFRAIQDKLKE